MTENRAWKKLPDEQGWWWFWAGHESDKPFLLSILPSHSDEPFCFVHNGDSIRCDQMNGDSIRCDQVGGFWLKAEVPAPPTAVERADAEAAWLKRFEGTMKADTERVVEDTKIEGEKHEPTVDN